MNLYFPLFVLFSIILGVFTQGYIPPGEVRAIEQAFVDGEQTGASMNSYGGYGGYGYGNYGGYGGYYNNYWGKK